MTSLGARIKSLRLEAGLSQNALAAGLVSKSMISQIEADKARPSRELLQRLAHRLGVTADELLPAQYEDQQRLARFKQAQAFFLLGHYEDALHLFRECLRDPHPHWSMLELYEQTGDCQRLLESQEQARSFYEEAMRLAVFEEDPQVRVRLLYRLGECAAAAGDWRLAVQEWERAGRVVQEGTERSPLALSLAAGLGKAHWQLGEYAQAVRCFEQAEQLSRTDPCPARTLAAIRYGWGMALCKLGEWQQAEPHLRQAEALYAQIKDGPRLMRARLQLGVLMRECGRLHQAVEMFKSGLEAIRGQNRSEIAARLYCELALTWQALGDIQYALALLKKADGHLPVGHRYAGVIRLVRANVYEEAGRLEAAGREAASAAEMLQGEAWEEELVRAYQFLSRLTKQQGDYKQASEWTAKISELTARRMRNLGWMI